MLVMEAATGKTIRPARLGTINFASPVYADGKIYHVEQNRRWYILTPDEMNGVVGHAGRGKTNGMFPSGNDCLASPVISHGRLYLLTTGALYLKTRRSSTARLTNLRRRRKRPSART
jgi:hypothetical protein